MQDSGFTLDKLTYKALGFKKLCKLGVLGL